MRTCCLCNKTVHSNSRFLAQNTVYKGETHWIFTHTYCFEQQVLKPGRVVADMIQKIAKQPLGRK
jgi:hypothetical protein